MTVRELIEKLKLMDQDARVMRQRGSDWEVVDVKMGGIRDESFANCFIEWEKINDRVNSR